ncbi:MAG: DUF4079 domain-containing protein [Geitlerinemataceae cyanobacterium]
MSIEIPAAIEPIITYFHPVAMWVLFAIVLNLAYSGYKVRRMRSAKGEERKAIVKGKFRDKHYVTASFMLVAMIFGTVGGIGVTYLNNSKLFLGPHLVVGLVMTLVVGISAALAPFMQKGNDLARNAHIAVNVALVVLFGWQAVSGMEIVDRIMNQ